MSDQWYIKTTSGNRGPYTMKQLQRYVDAGAIRPNAGIGDGEGQWAAAATLGGLTFPPEVIAKLRSGIQASAKKSTQARDSSLASGQQTDAASSAADASRDAQKARLDKLAEELSAKEAALVEQAATLDERVAALDERAAVLDEQTAELSTKTAELSTKTDAFDAQNAAHAEQAESFSDRTAELDARNEELETLAAKLEQQQSDLDSQAAELEKQREAVETEQTGLQRKTEELEQTTAELDTKTSELDTRAKELDELAAERESKHSELQSALSDGQSVSQPDGQSDGQPDGLAESETELVTLREELEAANSEQEKVEEQLASFEAEKAELLKRVEQLETQSEVDAKSLSDREESLAEARAEFELSQTEQREKLRELESQSELVKKEREEIDTQIAEHQSLSEQLDARAQTLDQKAASLSERESEIEQRNRDLVKRQREFDAAREGSADDGAGAGFLKAGVLAAGAAAVAGTAATGALPTEITPESILEEKRKLLRQFALRQESLSKREAELISREEELTERELSIAKINVDALPNEPLPKEPLAQESSLSGPGDSGSPSQALPPEETNESERTHQENDFSASLSASLSANDETSVEQGVADDVLHVSSVISESLLAEPVTLEPVTSESMTSEPGLNEVSPAERLLPQETPEILEAWPKVDKGPNESTVGESEAGRAEDELQDWLSLDDESAAINRLPSEDYDANLSTESSGQDVLESEEADFERSVSPENAGGIGLVDPVVVEEKPLSQWPTLKRKTNSNGSAEASSDPASAIVENPAGAVADQSLSEFRRATYEERFGTCSRYVADEDSAMKVDLSIHLPSGTRDFTTIVTSGMSDYPIPMPNGQRSVRAELLLYSTQVDDLAMEVIRAAAKVPYLKKQGLSIGSTCSLVDGGFTNSSIDQRDAVFMMPIIEDDSTPIPAKELVGNSIQLFWLLTITDAERKLIESQGIHKFLGMLEKHNHTRYFDPTRECYVKRKGWFRR